MFLVVPLGNDNSYLHLHFAYIYSRINFTSTIWSLMNSSYIHRMETVQGKFLKCLFNNYNFNLIVIDM